MSWRQRDKLNKLGQNAGCFYLKELVPHEIESFFNLCNSAGAFPAEICSGSPVEVICTLL